MSPASPVAFTVTISATPVAPATDEDFELSANRVLRFAANATESTGTVTIRTVHDGDPEPTDVVRVSGAVSNTAIPDPADVTVSIVNNDPEALDIAISALAAVDEDAGAAVVTVTLTTRKNTAPMANTELFYVGNPGETATRGDDYTPPPGTDYGSSVFVATVRPSAFSPNAAGTAWVAAPSFTIGIIDDQEAERDETIVFEVDFGEARPPTHTITIRDNDATPAVSIAADNPTVVEEQPAVFTLTRTGATGSPLTVTVSEQADRDLLPDGAATERTVRFGAGAATTALTVALENDRIAEPDGDLTVAVQAGAGYTPGAPSSATVTVDDGDTDTAPPTVTSVVVASTPYSGNTYRWGETIVFTVTFSEPVRVMGRPGLEVGLDNPAGASGSTVRAGFWGLSETEQVTVDSWPAPVSRYVHFGYSVRPFDRDADGVSVGANALRLASGDRIQSDETDTYAEFDHAALAPQRGHQVDGRETVDGEPTAPVAGAGITFVDTDGDPLELLANGTHRLSVPEGGEARYGLRLKTRPAHTVWVSHHYLTYGGDSDLTVPRNFSFDGSIAPDTWDTKTAWVKVAAAQDDDAEDGERVFDNRAFSRDPNYHDLVLPDVVVVEADDEEKGSSQGGAAEPLTAAFEGLPEAHHGETAFTFRIVFSEAVAVTPEAMRTRVLTVAGGAVTGAARVDGETGVWAITVTPDTREALSISLPPASDCDTDGAVCTSDGRALSIGAAHIVNGPADQPERNTSATGTPTIGGTPQVGERLTASTAGIADEDGLDNATFAYQWLVDDADISGATGSTYTLVDGDEGQAIKVRVSFTDDAGNEEELTSGATDAVAAPEPPAKPTGLSATPSHDRVVLTWDDPNDDTITGYVILRRNRDTDAQGQFTELAPDTGSAATTYTDDSVAAGTPYTYRIKAINGHGSSERSRWFHIDTLAGPEPTQEPTPEPESVSEGDADLPNDNSTPGRVAVGGSATGAIGTAGDQDRFAVELVAGRTYQFDLTGSPGGGGTLPDTFFRAIYNSAGQYQADSYNDDFDGGRDSRVTFTATESGTYYARVSGDRDEVGSYTLSVTDVTQ